MRFLALMSIAAIGVICLLDLFWRVGGGASSAGGCGWEIQMQNNGVGDHQNKKFFYGQFC